MRLRSLTRNRSGAADADALDRPVGRRVRATLWRPSLLIRVVFFVALLGAFYASSLYSYILFHLLAELFGITILACLFIIVLNTRQYRSNDYMTLIGLSSLFVAILEIAHVLTYKGMNVITGYDANLPTQLWIAMRYLQSVSLLAAAYMLGRPIRIDFAAVIYTLVVTALLVSIFGGWFPACYVEGVGLTPFKIVSEYVISLIFLATVGMLWLRREGMEPSVWRLLIAAVGVSIAAELAFTTYVDVYGLANLLGHYLNIVSVYLIYKAIVETSLVRPYSLLFRDLERSREQLLALNETLEQRVVERAVVAEQRARQLSALAAQLAQAEQRERRRLAQVLHDGLQQLLVGMHFRLEVLQKRVSDQPVSELVREIEDLLLESIQASRSLVIDLSPPILYEKGLPEALAWLAQWMGEKHGLAVRVEADRRLDPESEDLRLLLFQTVRELLFNTVKHAGVQEATVHLSSPEEGCLEVVVSDRGAGMDVARARAGSSKSFGLYSLRQRLEAVGGTLEIDSAPGQGTRVTVQVPHPLPLARDRAGDGPASAGDEGRADAVPVGQPRLRPTNC